jgi:hypothetical protein
MGEFGKVNPQKNEFDSTYVCTLKLTYVKNIIPLWNIYD